MKVVLYGVVRPDDGSPLLPPGTYDVGALKWALSTFTDSLRHGVATFVVTSGEHAGPRRRIGCVTETEASLDAFMCSDCHQWTTICGPDESP